MALHITDTISHRETQHGGHERSPQRFTNTDLGSLCSSQDQDGPHSW